jgi:phosphoribosylanthranilate isomerase
MSVFVKICGLRDAQTVAAAIEAGADAIGFVFAESPRRVSVDQAFEAVSGVGASVKRVAVMRHPSNDEWQEVLENFAPDVLQTDIQDFAELEVPPQVQAWPVFRQGGRIPSQDLPYVFVYEGQSSGAGETVDWVRAAALSGKGRMVLAGGLSSGNVARAIGEARPWGVDVSSGVESSPGVKDKEKIRQFISAVRAAEIET